RRSSAFSIRRYRIDVTRPRTMRTQSRQKNATSASAVATWRPTMNARYGDSGAETDKSAAHRPPISAGSSTLCPRLDTGNSSLTPCRRPTTIASGYVIIDATPQDSTNEYAAPAAAQETLAHIHYML